MVVGAVDELVAGTEPDVAVKDVDARALLWTTVGESASHDLVVAPLGVDEAASDISPPVLDRRSISRRMGCNHRQFGM